MTTGSPDSPQLVCMFHLNLAFSSLEADEREKVISTCYWPMLSLASDTSFPIAFEATGWTLGEIAALDPDWVSEARRLIGDGRVEFVGSAQSQTAMPLMPSLVNAWNLKLGRESYESILGTSPRLALVCEQAYSPGLVSLYEECGYEGIIVDWENAYRSHHEWPDHTRRHPQLAQGSSSTIPIIWSESIAFQKFQRFAHGEISLERYVDFVSGEIRGGSDSMLLYANDAEVFDHRPGRFAAEPDIGHDEWSRIRAALEALASSNVGSPSLPSQLLDSLGRPASGISLTLESPGQPVPVKKQDKYNIGRWAVSGRDDVGINTRCWRIFNALRASDSAAPEDWRQLCELWASDFRTHITESRWYAMLAELTEMEARLGLAAPSQTLVRDDEVLGSPPGVVRSGDRLDVECGDLRVSLNCRRGLAVEAFSDLRVGSMPLVGTVEHGYFSAIELGADWYTGNFVLEEPLRHKVTDLERCEPTIEAMPDGSVRVSAQIATELGPVPKLVEIDASGITVDTTFNWAELRPGSLRVGHVTFLPEAFDAQTLWYGTNNGGNELEVHELGDLDRRFDHGEAVSTLVSSNQGLGVTEGVLLIGDHERVVKLEVDQSVAKPLGLMAYWPFSQSFFLQAAFSLTESDDTRRGAIRRTPEDPQRFRYRIELMSYDEAAPYRSPAVPSG